MMEYNYTIINLVSVYNLYVLCFISWLWAVNFSSEEADLKYWNITISNLLAMALIIASI